MLQRINSVVGVFALSFTLFLVGCVAQGQQNSAPSEEKVKNAYFSAITCQGEMRERRLEDAEHFCKLGIKELEGYSHPLQEALYSGLAEVYLAEGQYASAEQIQMKLIGLTAQMNGKHSANYAIAVASYGSSMARNGKFAEATPFIDEALPILKRESEAAKSLAGSYDWYSATLNRKAMVQVSEGKDLEARKTLQELSIYQGRSNIDNANLEMALANTYANVGEIYYHLPNIKKAQPFYEKALKIFEQSALRLQKVQQNTKHHFGKTIVIPTSEVVMAGRHLVDVYHKSGSTKEAAALACKVKGWEQYYKYYPEASQN